MNLVFAGASFQLVGQGKSNARSFHGNETSSTTDSQATIAASAILLSALCGCDGESAMSDYEFNRGWSQLGFDSLNRIAISELDDDLLQTAIETLTGLSPPEKKRLLLAISETIAADAKISDQEQEMLKKMVSIDGKEVVTLEDLN